MDPHDRNVNVMTVSQKGYCIKNGKLPNIDSYHTEKQNLEFITSRLA